MFRKFDRLELVHSMDENTGDMAVSIWGHNEGVPINSLYSKGRPIMTIAHFQCEALFGETPSETDPEIMIRIDAKRV